MPQIIKNIHIENFKSAKNVELTDCKRINLPAFFEVFKKERSAAIYQGGKYIRAILQRQYRK